jgi:hypothetical protein
MKDVGKFNGNLVFLMPFRIFYGHFVYFSTLGVLYQEKSCNPANLPSLELLYPGMKLLTKTWKLYDNILWGQNCLPGGEACETLTLCSHYNSVGFVCTHVVLHSKTCFTYVHVFLAFSVVGAMYANCDYWIRNPGPSECNAIQHKKCVLKIRKNTPFNGQSRDRSVGPQWSPT